MLRFMDVMSNNQMRSSFGGLRWAVLVPLETPNIGVSLTPLFDSIVIHDMGRSSPDMLELAVIGTAGQYATILVGDDRIILDRFALNVAAGLP